MASQTYAATATAELSAAGERRMRDDRHLTEDVTRTRGTSWEDHHLTDAVLQGLVRAGFSRPSPVQEDVIPKAIAGRDVIARAKNGTGKTASFVIPILEHVDVSKNYVQAMVIVHSRELAQQISGIIKELGHYVKGLEVMRITGGTAVVEDVLRLKQKVHVVVGTPGRMLDLMSRGVLKLGQVKLVALDEADKLLDGSNIDDVVQMLSETAKDHQTLLVSATFPATVKSFAERHMRDVVFVNKMSELTLRGLSQFYAIVTEQQKVRCLSTCFSKLEISQCIIFCNSKKRCELLAQYLVKMGAAAKDTCYYIHSDLPQVDRNRVLHEFAAGNVRTLVASDLVARGLDVQTVNVVINFDFPASAETYLHRAGRAGRFGHRGLVVNFITESDKAAMFRIESELNTQIEAIPPHVDRSLYCE